MHPLQKRFYFGECLNKLKYRISDIDIELRHRLFKIMSKLSWHALQLYAIAQYLRRLWPV